MATVKKSLKAVDSSKKPGLAKLPTEVRNKMGYQQNGGTNPKKKTGMDAVKAVGKYVSTFGGATERDNPKQKDINIVKKLKETGTKVKNKLGLKTGGTVKKCRGGCK